MQVDRPASTLTTRTALLLCALYTVSAGCVRTFEGVADDAATATDARRTDADGTDAPRDIIAATDATPTDSGATFGSGGWQLGQVHKLQPAINSADTIEAGPWLSPDGRMLYFSRGLGSSFKNWDIHRAPRLPGGTFGVPEPLAQLNGAQSNELHLSMSRDGLHAALTSDRAGTTGEGADLWIGRRTATSEAWTAAHFVRAKAASEPVRDHDSLISWDGLRITFAAETTAANMELYVSRRSTTADTFGPREPIAEINTIHREDSPALSPDERVIVFCSDRPGGSGSDDLWWARRTAGGTFGPAQPVPGINTGAKEREAFISHDGRELFFASNREGGGDTQWDLYRVAILAGP